MDLISLVKDKLNDAVIDKISVFLGENPTKIGEAMNSAVPAVLGGIMQKSTNYEDTGKVMDILKEGGHTGDILDNLSGLLSNFDKTQVLITIGSNISNHFLGDKTNSVIETLSSVSGIRKTSASSLIGLSMPLMLGAIGKIVAKEGLGVSGLMKLISDQKEHVLNTSPPVLSNLLDIRNIGTPPENKVNKVINETEHTEQPNWIPWIFLLLLGIGALAWVKGCKGFFKKDVKIADSVTTLTIPPATIPKKDTATFTHIIQNKNSSPTKDSSNNSEKKTNEIPTPVPIKVEPNKNLTPEGKTTYSHKTPKKEEITLPINKVHKKARTQEFSNHEKPKNSVSLNEKLTENSGAWHGLDNLTFQNKSAELTYTNQLDELAKFMNSHPKSSIKIAGFKDGDSLLSSDRAWAVREILLEKGISEDRIEIADELISGVNSAKVAVKIIK